MPTAGSTTGVRRIGVTALCTTAMLTLPAPFAPGGDPLGLAASSAPAGRGGPLSASTAVSDAAGTGAGAARHCAFPQYQPPHPRPTHDRPPCAFPAAPQWPQRPAWFTGTTSPTPSKGTKPSKKPTKSKKSAMPPKGKPPAKPKSKPKTKAKAKPRSTSKTKPKAQTHGRPPRGPSTAMPPSTWGMAPPSYPGGPSHWGTGSHPAPPRGAHDHDPKAGGGATQGTTGGRGTERNEQQQAPTGMVPAPPYGGAPPPGPSSPTLPPVPPSSTTGPSSALPPVTMPSPPLTPPPQPPRVVTDGHDFALAGQRGEHRDWAAVFAVILVTEVGLLWLLACLLVLLRKLGMLRLVRPGEQ